MNRQLSCRSCGETDELTGPSSPEGIRITCGRCGTSWLRDTAAACATCGGTELETRPQATTAYSAVPRSRSWAGESPAVQGDAAHPDRCRRGCGGAPGARVRG